jgi:integrase
MRVKLDADFCKNARCLPGKKRTDYWDINIKGFVLECYESGKFTLTFRFFDEYGRQRQRKIGNLGDITFAQAQAIAKRWRAEVTMGGDPATRKAEKKLVPTYKELADQHLAFAKSYQKRPGNLDAVLRVHITPKWGTKRLDEITTPAIAVWLGELRASGLAPSTVEKIRVTFNRSFELALKWGTKGVTHNPVRGIPRPKFSNARDRFLTSEQAARLLEACSASINPQLRNIVGLLLLTGARKRELLDAKWENVDLDRRVWFIPTSKTGKSRHVPLSQPALDLIRQLPRFDKCPWLLPNPRTRKPFTDIKHPWETAREAAGLDGLRIHDLRHSAASFMINAGIDLFAVGRILGHADHQSTMRYSHLANETLMRAVEARAAKMNVSWASPAGAETNLA